MASTNVKVGIIGGSGHNNAEFFKKSNVVHVPETPFGNPSETELQEGEIEGVPCVLLPRHGRKHTIMPSEVNYRANIYALKECGCTHILASTACGSLREEIKPGDFVILDQFIDRTTQRQQTFYCSNSPFKGILHIPMSSPFCERTKDILINACDSLGYKAHTKGTVITVEGPRFSTKAESNLYRSWGGHVINMTTVPEVILAREVGLAYASVAMATDYDCWKEEDEVNVEKVLSVIKSNAERGIEVIRKAVLEIGRQDWTATLAEMERNVKMNLLPH